MEERQEQYTMDELTKRVNELYHKSQAEGLTDAEKEEQTRLRRAYVANIRSNLRGQLDQISIVEKDGSITNLGERFGKEKKKKLRKEALSQRDAMHQKEREEKSRDIREKLFAMDVYKEAPCILSYVNYKSEVMTESILSQALADGKQLFVPKVSGQEMEFYQITALEELSPGYQGIREPSAGKSFAEVRESLSKQGAPLPLMLIPGAAFDAKRHRIGYGAGFYDKYLQKTAEAGISLHTLALGFECQMVQDIPAEAHDVRPDMLLTEQHFYG